MALVTPHAWTAGDDATSGNLQTVTDAVTQLQGGTPSGSGTTLDFFTAVQSTAQTGLASGVGAGITFTTEYVDSAGGHSTSTSTSQYVGKNAGYYEIGGVVAFAASASGTRRFVELALNGTAVGGTHVSVPVHASIMAVPLPPGIFVYMNGTTDYVELRGAADYASWATVVSGSAASRLSVRWVHS